MDQQSRLVKMRIVNFGCIGLGGLEIALDDIVCLVGANNSGKSTILRAYEAAVKKSPLVAGELNSKSNGQPAQVELWIHIPRSAGNVDEKWKVESDGLLLVRSLWSWDREGAAPVRETWDPESGNYSPDGKAGGADAVFNSRLPIPFRIGSLEDPEQEHKLLLELVLQPIKERLSAAMKKGDSELRRLIGEVETETKKSVEEFRDDIDKISAKVNASYQRIFPDSEVTLRPALSDLNVKPADALIKGTRIELSEGGHEAGWQRQGTGSQRALFWSMLEARSELKRISDAKVAEKKKRADTEKAIAKLEVAREKAKTEKTKVAKQAEIDTLKNTLESPENAILAKNTFLPGHMLLIDEPETALHPAAVRAAQDHLYKLASDGGWQVMLTTHHPAFLDPLQDHTTIIRLHRRPQGAVPNIYRSEEVSFSREDKLNLKSLLAFDTTIAEMFFSPRVIIVEGDTELASFTEIMLNNPSKYAVELRPLILRARGKSTILILIKMLEHFRVDFAVLHDIDPPRTKNGKRANGRYTDNQNICNAILSARSNGMKVVHQCSCPGFEIQHGMDLPPSDKPFHAWQTIRENHDVKKSVTRILDALLKGDGNPNAIDDGSKYESAIKSWAKLNAMDNPRYQFLEDIDNDA